jgi:hypothetical protein
LAFIDFEKAFDALNRRIIWKTLEEYGIPTKILKILKDMYEGFKCQVLHEGKLTEYIEVTTGVHQGCILSNYICTSVGWTDEEDVGCKEERDPVGYEG